MDNPATMNLHNLREHISNLEFRRDKLGCGKDVIDRLNAARTELSSRTKHELKDRFEAGANPCDRCRWWSVKATDLPCYRCTHNNALPDR